jgi:thiol-disulfide isomerase/thioredoxin
MKTRWAIAVLGVVALAAVTISTQMPWLFKPEVEMVDTTATASNGDAASTLACPADARPANYNFTMKDHLGNDVALSSFKGKVLLIDFWATWCGPCKVEIPHFVEFQEKFGKDGLQIVGITVDDTAEKVTPYINDMKMNYPVLLGLGHDDVQEAYGPIVGIPVSVLVSRDGRICATHTGLTGKDVFEREIKALL